VTPAVEAILREWTPPIGANIAIVLSAAVYGRGWLRLHSFFSRLFPTWRLIAFLGGLLALWIAVCSPLEAFDDASLAAHMVQHMLLMAVAPPLLLLGAPTLPVLRGLPRSSVRRALGPLLRWPPVQRLGHFLTHPAIALAFASVALVAWHIPAAFELALRSNRWHETEHACFFTTSLLFWWPVVQPFPSRARWPRWSMPVYLLFGMLPCGALGAFLTFFDRVIYAPYRSQPAIFFPSPLADQVFAGLLMWVFGLIIYLLPAVAITFQLLSPEAASQQSRVPVQA